MSPILHATRITLAVVVLSTAGSALPQNRLDSATPEQLIEALTQPRSPSSLGASRSLAVAPDPTTHLCTISATAAKGPSNLVTELSRGLYRVDSPKVDLNVRFEFDSAKLTHESEEILSALAAALQSPKLAEQRFAIAGHTDHTGSDEHNARLSCARALAVRDYLVRKGRIATKRLVSLGFGSMHPLESGLGNDDINRRVEVRKL